MDKSRLDLNLQINSVSCNRAYTRSFIKVIALWIRWQNLSMGRYCLVIILLFCHLWPKVYCFRWLKIPCHGSVLLKRLFFGVVSVRLLSAVPVFITETHFTYFAHLFHNVANNALSRALLSFKLKWKFHTWAK